jgi:glycosyltransferase involved in cell wall biosynthesis
MITYIVPSYNQGLFIKYTLDSILVNMGACDQLIIADGASKDNTAEVVATYLSDKRIEWHSEPDRGFSDAMAKALKLVRNPIVGIMSSDDAYKSSVRDRVLPLFNDPEVVLAYGDYEMIDVDNRHIGEFRHGAGNLADVLSLRVILPQSSVFFRLSALSGKNILNLEHDYVADVVLFNQVCMAGKFLYVPEMWSQVRKHEGSRSGRRDPGLQYLNAIETSLAGMPVELKEKAWAGALLLRSRHLATLKQRWKATRSMLAALAIDPMSINHWLLPRTLLYIFFGVIGIRFAQWIRSAFLTAAQVK